ncbi:MAG: CoB--CoM heterodisulfide reductase iron-sulfur subunit B family protein [Desulfarculaceae bacterium]|nr:CoB--CoM heterodisulfide reductase iron-sulfur subunit B family protein [Desulfarculaceae bacterium]
MRFALFLGCKIPAYVPHYEIATRRVMAELGVELVDVEFPCCGYPLRHLYFRSYLLAGARAMALSEARGLDLVTPCKCCFGSLQRVRAFLEERPELREEINQELAEEGLAYTGAARVLHILQVLHDELGAPALRERVVRPFEGLDAAVLYGCHLVRPSKITRFDDPARPHIIDQLVSLTGARPVPYAGRLNCCGAPVRERNEELSLAMIRDRLSEARDAGAHILVIACPYSQMQAEWAYTLAGPEPQRELIQGPVLYPQLLGLSMGLGPDELALTQNIPSAEYLLSFLPRP